MSINPLKTKLNSICHLLALLEAHHIFHVSGLRVNLGLRKVNHCDIPYIVPHFNSNAHLLVYNSRYLDSSCRGVNS